MQQIVSRNVDPLKSAVLTVGSINSGKANNVIPDTAEITGTVRTFDNEVRNLIENRMNEMCKALEMQNNVQVTLDYQYGHTSLYNHNKETRELKAATETLLAINKL